jgi:hypothetical protein
MNDEIVKLKTQLQESQLTNKAILNELSIIKSILVNKLGVEDEIFNHYTKSKKIKIVDNLKIFHHDSQISNFESAFCFDINFETKNMLNQKLVWKAYFCEEAKEDFKCVLKCINLKNRGGSVQIKLLVPALSLNDFDVNSLIKNGGFI